MIVYEIKYFVIKTLSFTCIRLDIVICVIMHLATQKGIVFLKKSIMYWVNISVPVNPFCC